MGVEEIPLSDDRFAIVQNEIDWLRPAFWESIFSLSNGLLGCRGSFEEPMAGTHSCPMSFMAGFYNTPPRGLPELPILPDWLDTRIVLDGSAFDLRTGHIQRFARWLDMRRGVLGRDVLWQDPGGRTTHLQFVRFLSLAEPHLGVVRIRITPIDWSGRLDLKTQLTAPRDARGKSSSHWSGIKARTAPEGTCWLKMRTRQTRRPLVAAAAYTARCGGAEIPCREVVKDDRAGREYRIEAESGKTVEFDRYVVFLAGEADAKAPARQARDMAIAARDEGFDSHLGRHASVCASMWDHMDVEIDGSADEQRAIRFNLFQLASLCPPLGEVASIGPKGLSGTAYLGHIFWDTEIYMVPFFSLTSPEGARTLLEYRYETLPGARRKARSKGYRGAQYAWESADTGDEACPRFLPDPQTGGKIRIWCGEIQDHISADVPYAIDQYVRATGDEDFLWDYGAEIFFETARFWAGRARRGKAGAYEIRDALGPDEYHVHVNNDAFNNYLAHWNLTAAADLYDHPAFPRDKRGALIKQLRLKPAEPARWRRIASALKLAYDENTGFVEQSDGFTARPDLSPHILRMPRNIPITELVGAELVSEAQVLKQAEVVLLQYLLEKRFDRRSREANFDYYEPRTSHDSSLSVSAHALAAARLGRLEQAYDFFRRAVRLDLDDLAGNSAAGLHTANMGGVWLTLAFGFAGLSIDGPEPVASPRLPAAWNRLRLIITHRGARYAIDCDRERASVQRI